MNATERSAARSQMRNTSNLCIRKLHDQCVAGVCECDCHGRPIVRGTPKDQPIDLGRKGSPVNIIDAAAKPLAVVPTPTSHDCEERGCGQSFATPNALAIHHGRKHKAKTTVAKPSKADPPPNPKPKAAPVRRLAGRTVLVVDHAGEVTAIALSTRADADQVVQLLDDLGITTSTIIPG